MTTKAAIQDFLAQRTLAVVGVSRTGKKFGNTIMKELSARGYRVFAVNARGETAEGRPVYPTLSDLPEPPGGAVLVIPPSETEKVVRDAARAGISRIWMQHGSRSREAIRFCEDRGIRVIHGECILMFAEPVSSIHRVHRWLRALFRKLP
jgi:predicted CoA-binding protein